MPLKQEVAEQLTGQWQVGLFEAPCKAPLPCLLGCCCMCCMAGKQRLEIIDVLGEDYVCCGGMFPCGPLGNPQDRNCAWAEACCCTGLAIAGNRFLIQTRLDRQNTACDDCILWVTCLAPLVLCICQCAGCDVPEGIEHCVHFMTITVDGCMLAQQQVEIDHVKEVGFAGANPAIVAMLPPLQQQMIGQARPMGPAAHAGMAAGAILGGAAGAGAMMGAAGAGRPAPTAMGQAAGGRHGEMGGPPMQMAMSAKGGFMNTMAPNGMPWWQYCQGIPATVDPGSGLLVGPWGECLAWAKVFEVHNPGWSSDPNFAGGPAGQVVHAALSTCPPHLRAATEQAAERLEMACGQAAFNGAPLPLIGQRA